MQLNSLVPGLTGEAGEQTVTGFAIDHRKIAPGNVFGAFRGAKFNGEDFIESAVAAGAIAVVGKRRLVAGQFFGLCRSGDRNQRQDIDRRAYPSAVADGRL